jgi:formate dehydrogenase
LHQDALIQNCPLHEGTRGLFDTALIGKMKRNSWLVNTARGAICDRHAVADALKSGQLLGYAGDVWDVQPAPQDHPWRGMRNKNGESSLFTLIIGGGNGMVPHMSGTTLDAQKRYADGTKEIIRRYLAGEQQDPANLIVEGGQYASKAYGQRDKASGQKGPGP